jgi:hypothetical protein
MSNDAFDQSQLKSLGAGKMILLPQTITQFGGITILTTTSQNVMTTGKVSPFPPNNTTIVTGFTSKTFGQIRLVASVNITLVTLVTDTTVSLELMTKAGTILASVPITPGTQTYTLETMTYTQPGTQYFVDINIFNIDVPIPGLTTVTVNSGTFSIKIKSTSDSKNCD